MGPGDDAARVGTTALAHAAPGHARACDLYARNRGAFKRRIIPSARWFEATNNSFVPRPDRHADGRVQGEALQS